MNEQREQTLKAEARRFIDGVLEINRRYGAQLELSDEEYRRAIDEAAKPFERVHNGSMRTAGM